MSVTDDLRRWGPEGCERVSLAEAEAYTRSLARGHYENFPIASRLLPRRLHQHFFNVYAFCRWADDLGDEIGDQEESRRLLAWWREELARCYRGDAEHPVFVALQPTIERFGIPETPFADLISAFLQDQEVTEYETFDQLRDYCRRSADPVGRIVLALCERVTEQNVAWSDSICTGLQLANMWQDVARDFDIGRVYLPAEDRERYGYTREMLRQRETTPGFLGLMEFEVNRARQYLLDGLPLVDVMPGRLKLDIELFAQGGLLILREIERIEYRVWERRPVVTKRALAGVALLCLWRRATRLFSRRASTSSGPHV